jgi:hypothetical protein
MSGLWLYTTITIFKFVEFCACCLWIANLILLMYNLQRLYTKGLYAYLH